MWCAVRNVKRESFEVGREGRGYWSDRYVFHDDIPLLADIENCCAFSCSCHFRNYQQCAFSRDSLRRAWSSREYLASGHWMLT